MKQAPGEGICLGRTPPALHVRCTEEETEEKPAPLPARIIVVILSPLLLLLGGGGPAAAAAPLRREGGGFLSPSLGFSLDSDADLLSAWEMGSNDSWHLN